MASEPETEVMIRPSELGEGDGHSSTAADDKNAREIDVDEYLKYVGECGKFQILLVLLFCLIIIPTTYQTLIMSFVGSNPSWRCVQMSPVGNTANFPNTTVSTNNATLANATANGCNLKGDIEPGHSLYKNRCTMDRVLWEFTKPKEYSIVTDVSLLQCSSVPICNLCPGM